VLKSANYKLMTGKCKRFYADNNIILRVPVILLNNWKDCSSRCKYSYDGERQVIKNGEVAVPGGIQLSDVKLLL